MKRTIISLMTWLMTLGMMAQNSISLSSAEGNAGEEVTVSILLENTDAVSAVELSIPLDDLLNYVPGSAAVSNRTQSHSVSAGVKDGKLNIMVYSLTMSSITGNSGEIATFKLKLGNQPTSVYLSPSTLTLTDATGHEVSGYVYGNSILIRCSKAEYSTMTVDFGRVAVNRTASETVTITNVGNADLTVTGFTQSDYVNFTTEAQLPMTIAPYGNKTFTIKATPNKRGLLQKTLKVDCNSISKLNTIALNVEAFTVNELHVGNASGTADTEVTIPLIVNNEDAINGFQLEFDLPDQLTYVDGSFTLSSRKKDHAVATSVNGKKIKVVAYSGSGAAFTGSDGEIASFKVKLSGRNGVTLKPNKAILTAMIEGSAVDVLSDVYEGRININSPQLSVPSSIDFGRVPVTEDCNYELTIKNNGTAPLTISRIVFNNEALSVEEALPMTIAANGQEKVTVVYNSTEEKDFDAIMQIYSNDPDQRVFNINVTGNRFAPNYLYFSTLSIGPVDDLKLNVSYNTYDHISGLQFDVEYPHNYYKPYDNNITLYDIAAGMTVTSRQINENTLRYFCYFISGQEILPSKGQLMTIEFQPIVDIVPQNTYTIEVKNIKMGTIDLNNKYAGTDLKIDFSVINLKGDVNDDGDVDIADAVCIVNHIVGKPNATFIEAAADANGDGDIDIADAVHIVNYVVGKINALAPKFDITLREPQ